MCVVAIKAAHGESHLRGCRVELVASVLDEGICDHGQYGEGIAR